MPIGNASKSGNNFTLAAAYDLAQGPFAKDKKSKRPEILIKNEIFSDKHDEIGEECRYTAKARTDVKKPVFKFSINFNKKENLSREIQLEFTKRILGELGIADDNFQYMVTAHHDKPHPHHHILLNRVGLDGTLWTDSFSFPRLEKAIDKTEKLMGLDNSLAKTRRYVYNPDIAKGYDFQDRSIREKKDNTIVASARDKKKSLERKKVFVQEAVDRLLNKQHVRSWNELQAELLKSDIDLQTRTDASGKVTGTSFRYKDYAVKGTAINFRANTIQKNIEANIAADRQHAQNLNLESSRMVFVKQDYPERPLTDTEKHIKNALIQSLKKGAFDIKVVAANLDAHGISARFKVFKKGLVQTSYVYGNDNVTGSDIGIGASELKDLLALNLTQQLFLKADLAKSPNKKVRKRIETVLHNRENFRPQPGSIPVYSERFRTKPAGFWIVKRLSRAFKLSHQRRYKAMSREMFKELENVSHKFKDAHSISVVRKALAEKGIAVEGNLENLSVSREGKRFPVSVLFAEFYRLAAAKDSVLASLAELSLPGKLSEYSDEKLEAIADIRRQSILTFQDDKVILSDGKISFEAPREFSQALAEFYFNFIVFYISRGRPFEERYHEFHRLHGLEWDFSTEKPIITISRCNINLPDSCLEMCRILLILHKANLFIGQNPNLATIEALQEGLNGLGISLALEKNEVLLSIKEHVFTADSYFSMLYWELHGKQQSSKLLADAESISKQHGDAATIAEFRRYFAAKDISFEVVDRKLVFKRKTFSTNASSDSAKVYNAVWTREQSQKAEDLVMNLQETISADELVSYYNVHGFTLEISPKPELKRGDIQLEIGENLSSLLTKVVTNAQTAEILTDTKSIIAKANENQEVDVTLELASKDISITEQSFLSSEIERSGIYVSLEGQLLEQLQKLRIRSAVKAISSESNSIKNRKEFLEKFNQKGLSLNEKPFLRIVCEHLEIAASTEVAELYRQIMRAEMSDLQIYADDLVRNLELNIPLSEIEEALNISGFSFDAEKMILTKEGYEIEAGPYLQELTASITERERQKALEDATNLLTERVTKVQDICKNDSDFKRFDQLLGEYEISWEVTGNRVYLSSGDLQVVANSDFVAVLNDIAEREHRFEFLEFVKTIPKQFEKCATLDVLRSGLRKKGFEIIVGSDQKIYLQDDSLRISADESFLKLYRRLRQKEKESELKAILKSTLEAAAQETSFYYFEQSVKNSGVEISYSNKFSFKGSSDYAASELLEGKALDSIEYLLKGRGMGLGR